MSTHETHDTDRARIEAALFLAPQPMTRRGLAKLLDGVPLAYVDRVLEELKAEYAEGRHGIELHVEDGRAMLRVKAAHVNAVAHLAPQQDIPRPVLRTLAVIAYNHPMTQADAVRVRGNKAYSHIQELLERGLLRAEDHGRTLLLHVTKEFLRHFGLNSVEEFRFHFSAAPEEVEMENQDGESDPQTEADGDSSDRPLDETPQEDGYSDDTPSDPTPSPASETGEEEIEAAKARVEQNVEAPESDDAMMGEAEGESDDSGAEREVLADSEAAEEDEDG